MPIHDDLGKRMKEFYENVPKTKLMRRTPVAIRIGASQMQPAILSRWQARLISLIKHFKVSLAKKSKRC